MSSVLDYYQILTVVIQWDEGMKNVQHFHTPHYFMERRSSEYSVRYFVQVQVKWTWSNSQYNVENEKEFPLIFFKRNMKCSDKSYKSLIALEII